MRRARILRLANRKRKREKRAEKRLFAIINFACTKKTKTTDKKPHDKWQQTANNVMAPNWQRLNAYRRLAHCATSQAKARVRSRARARVEAKAKQAFNSFASSKQTKKKTLLPQINELLQKAKRNNNKKHQK